MKTITIQTNKGPRVHEAYLHGKFAVHLPLDPVLAHGDDGEHYYAITHIASGRRVMSVYYRAEARKIAKRLDAALDFDITAEDISQKTERWQKFIGIVRPIVKGGE